MNPAEKSAITIKYFSESKKSVCSFSGRYYILPGSTLLSAVQKKIHYLQQKNWKKPDNL